MRTLYIILLCMLLRNAGWAGDNMSKGIDSLCNSLVSSLAPDILKARIAVVPFSSEVEGTSSSCGLSVAEYMVVFLQKRGCTSLVERAEFKKVAQEIGLSQTGLVEEKSVLNVGKILSAEYILTGSVLKTFGRYSITARLIKTETSAIVSSAAVSVPCMDLDAYTKELLGERQQVHSVVFRSVLLPGWGQLYAGYKKRGVASTGLCLGSAAYMVFSIITALNVKKDYDEHIELGNTRKFNPQELEAHDKKSKELYNNYSDKHDRANIAAIVTASLWCLNIGDAFMVGLQSRKKINLYFSVISDKRQEIGVVFSY